MQIGCVLIKEPQDGMEKPLSFGQRRWTQQNKTVIPQITMVWRRLGCVILTPVFGVSKIHQL